MLQIEIPFYTHEIECNCGCGQAIRQPELLRRLVIARWISRVGFYVNSWNRCPDYNRQVGGLENSEHLKGYAVDISALACQEKFSIISGAIFAGFKRIGVYPWGLHLGADPNKPQNVFWLGG